MADQSVDFEMSQSPVSRQRNINTNANSHYSTIKKNSQLSQMSNSAMGQAG